MWLQCAENESKAVQLQIRTQVERLVQLAAQGDVSALKDPFICMLSSLSLDSSTCAGALQAAS